MAETTARGTLVTFPPSVDSETARWVLSHHRVPFAEKRNSGVGSALQTLRFRAAIPILRIDGHDIAGPRPMADFLDARVDPNQRLTPDDDALAREIDALWSETNMGMGYWIAQWVYDDVLRTRALSLRLLTEGVPTWQRVAEGILHPLTVFAMKRGRDLHLPETPHRALGQCRRVFDVLSERLEKDQRPYLVGERFSLADLAFAACAAPMMLDGAYGGALPTPGEASPRLREVARELRATPAGVFARKLYRNHYRPLLTS